jgi:hypothetical protein
MRRRQTWIGALVMTAVLLVISTGLGHADRGGHGHKGHGYRSHGHGGHGYRSHGHRGHWHKGHGHRRHGHSGVRVFISPGLVVPFGAYWGPYSPPPVVVAPPPRAYVEPSPPPPTYWYYCDAPQAYYPYVEQCPSGWRQVSPTPPG